MKTVGNKNLFAITYDLELVKPDNYYGNIWFWINNKRIGSDNANTYLSSSVHYLKEFFELKPLRRYLGSNKIESEELFYKLCSVFGTEKAKKENRYLNFSIYRDIFWLESVGDANFSEDVKIVLIDEPELSRQRFLWKRYEDENLEEFYIRYGYFEEVANEFILKIEKDVEAWNE